MGSWGGAGAVMTSRMGEQGGRCWAGVDLSRQMATGEASDTQPPFHRRLFRERLSQLRLRLEEVGAERAPEYTEPLGGLQQSLQIRIQVAGL